MDPEEVHALLKLRPDYNKTKVARWFAVSQKAA